MRIFFYLFLFLSISVYFKITNGANILGFFPALSKSHMVLAQGLCDGLTNKGHNVTLVSPYAKEKGKNNFREIKMPDLQSVILKNRINNTFELRDAWKSKDILESISAMTQMTEVALNNTNVQNLLHSNEKFDVIIVEIIMNEAHLALGYHFNVPVIAFTTVGASSLTDDLVGNPSPYAYVPNFQLPFSDRMTFFQRVINVLVETCIGMMRYFLFLPNQQELVRKYFPQIKDDIYTIMANVSLVLLNSHSSLTYARAYVPNMIEIGGFHINASKSSPLSPDLQQFLDDAPNGVVYFSMGSILKSTDLSEEKRNAFVEAFGQLKEKVLWKWENETLPNKPDNLILSPWLPQQTVLAHPNIKLFITHGGLLSTSEAIYNGVPFVGIPIFADQYWNVMKAKLMGYATMVDFDSISAESLKAVINTVLNDQSFKKNAEYRSLLLKDQQISPMDKAVYWVEHVIRYKGASFRKSGLLYLNKLQYLQIDIIAFAGAIIFFGVIVFRYLIKNVCKRWFNSKVVKEKTN